MSNMDKIKSTVFKILSSITVDCFISSSIGPGSGIRITKNPGRLPEISKYYNIPESEDLKKITKHNVKYVKSGKSRSLR